MTAIYVGDANMASRLLAEREASGADRYDEVWDGVYFMTPIANPEHQRLALRLGAAFEDLLGHNNEIQIFPGVNVSDREEGWERNYRVPDVAVVLPGGRARECSAHLCGGPDLIVEILSPGDRAHEKLPFYAGIGVREALFIDRDPWAIELYRLEGKDLVFQGRSALDQPVALDSTVLPASFRLLGSASQAV
ncbi:MAG TPA: Uma2 family endonuclease, partial [Gemmataceae bacterium]|nr:Uma2 family endonuclease [Gemmataceae bacterium]